jgi:tetratricopeptide (TPR) repeat protein
VSELERIQVAADRFFAVHDMPTFKALTALNVGRAFMAMNRLDEAIDVMVEMATCDTNNDYDGYKRSAAASVGLCCVRLGNLGNAKRWADIAEQGDTVTSATKFLRGMIALFEGRTSDARVPLNEAYELAIKNDYGIVVGEILLYRCIAYRDLGHIDTFWAVYQLAMTYVNNGSPYLRDQLEIVKRDMPNIS